MENAQLVGLSRQVSLRRELEVIANNIANVDTMGYKSQSLLLKEEKLAPAKENSFLRPDRPVSFVLDDGNTYDLNPGQMVTTGNETDVAIDGKGWFVVQTPQGERYTRNGSFAIDNQGTLVTRDGNQVMTEAGPLVLQPGETNLTIAADGTISTSQGSRGKLRVVDFQSPKDLKKIGETLFSGNNPQPATLPSLRQGQIEKSNVRAVVEMSRMIEVSRNYQAIAQWMAQADDLRRSAIDKLGTLS